MFRIFIGAANGARWPGARRCIFKQTQTGRSNAKHLARLQMPLLIIHGGRDAMVPVSRARAFAAALPHARLTIFPKAFHVPMDTDPPGFAQALREFCTDAEPNSAP
jgi:pimeloyl-ACP methyl ester carboxylesterase